MTTLHIVITRRSDGLRRELHWPDSPWQPHSEYWWSEGNAGCDCNRADWFAQAGNEEGEENPPCGSERYGVKITQGDDETVLYED